jgi:iron complex transport system permease protein
MNAVRRPVWGLGLALAALSLLLVAVGLGVGSTGWQPTALGLSTWGAGQDAAAAIVWDIRLPRSLGAWLAGALLGLSGAVAQGLFRNPLADPYLLGSASGAGLGVALLLALMHGAAAPGPGWVWQLGMAGAAFLGALGAVVLTLVLARGVQHTLRLLLAGVIVGVVLGAVASLLLLRVPDVMRAMQGFMLGTTSFIGWPAVQVLMGVGLPVLLAALAWGRSLDALVLGEGTATSLGVPLGRARAVLVSVMAMATGAAVAQVGLVAFIGLAAPHLVRLAVRPTHRGLILLSALAGGGLLLAADLVARGWLAPQELPVGVLTAVLGGGYLLWLMHRRAW